MNTRTVKWRIKCFEPDGEKWIKTIYLGSGEIEEIQNIVNSNDQEEMCGSYYLSMEMVEWLAIRFNNHEILDICGDLFLERDS